MQHDKAQHSAMLRKLTANVPNDIISAKRTVAAATSQGKAERLFGAAGHLEAAWSQRLMIGSCFLEMGAFWGYQRPQHHDAARDAFCAAVSNMLTPHSAREKHSLQEIRPHLLPSACAR